MTHPTRRTTLKGLAMALGATALPGCSTVAPPTPEHSPTDTATALAQLDAWASGQTKAMKRANLSVAVLSGEQIVWSKGYGLAEPERGTPATPLTRYRAGSVSKVFTAMAAMQLAEQGRLDLDAPLAEALPGFRMQSRFGSTQPVTPRLILSHRSGLPGDRTQGMWAEQPQPFTQLPDLLQAEYLAFAPGQVYAYSNLGYTLLGAAIAHTTGTPFEQWMQTQWLAPMGMRHSGFDTAAPSGPDAASAVTAEGKAVQELALRDTPAGGLNTNVLDLLQLARLWLAQGSLNGQALLSPRSVQDMQRPWQPETLADAATVGLGWHLLPDEFDGVGPLLWHAGGTLHHHAQLMLLPQLRLAVAVMSSTANAGELAHHTALKALALMATAQTGTDPTRSAKARPADNAHPAAPISSYPGTYDTPLGLARVTSDGQQARVEALGKRLHLVRQPNGYTRLEYRILGMLPVGLGKLSEMEFTRHDTPDGQGWLLVRHKGRFALVGTRLPPLPVPDAWQQRLGLYRYDGQDHFLATQVRSVRLLMAEGLLLAEVDDGQQSSQLALAPVHSHQATVRGLGRGRGDTVHASGQGANTVLEYSGMRFVKWDSKRDAA